MKTIIIIFLCNFISINFINAAYPSQKCYICDHNGCDHPGAGDIKDCSDNEFGGTSGKAFVNGALGKGNDTDIYKNIGIELGNIDTKIGLNDSTMPSWDSLTRWVCYVSKDKHRGCLVMAKGLCSGDNSWFGKITIVGDKISSIMTKAKDAVQNMFTDSATKSLTANQKLNISEWITTNYMSVLVDNKNGAQYQLDSCCEGDVCNFASIIQKPTAVLILLFLSTLILV